MLKMKSIINFLQSEVIDLSIDEQQFIAKDSANCYLIVSDYYHNGSQYCDLNELKSFINHNENFFLDMFKSDSKFVNRAVNKNSSDKKLNEFNNMTETEFKTAELLKELDNLDNFRLSYRASLNGLFSR